MDLRVHLRHPDAVLPQRNSSGDAGLDLVGVERTKFTDSEIWFDTHIGIVIPEGHVGLVYPRSSICNYGLALANSVGVIDSGYRGNVQIRFRRVAGPLYLKYYNNGERMAQLIVHRLPHVDVFQVDDLDEYESDRGHKGFGSSGV
jgi:dUTP pyrophosphatase